jgi:membrane protein required for colicin V production
MILDVILALCLGIALFHGYSKGLIASVVSVVSIAVSLVAAIKLSSVAGPWLAEAGVSSEWIPILSLIGVFIAAMLLFQLATKLLEGIMNVAGLSFFNRLGGGLLWVVAVALIVSTVAWYLDAMGIVPEEQKESSATFAILTQTAPAVIHGVGLVIPFIKDAFQELSDFFDQQAARIPVQ